MSQSPSGSQQTDYKEYLRYFVVVFVSIAHINPFYRIVICSTDMAVAFNIPVNNIGIYFSKLSGIRSLTMSLGFTIEYVISQISEKFSPEDKCNNIRKYMSVATLELLTACEIAFLLVLYFSKSVSFHNYIVLTLEAFIFGLFQISMVTLTAKYAAQYNLSLYVSGTIILVTQTIIDRCCKKDSVLSVKIQSWICVIFCVISMVLWSYYVLELADDSQESGTSGDQPAQSTTSCRSSRAGRSAGFIDGPPSLSFPNSLSKTDYFMSMSSLSILKIMRTELNRLCTCTDNRQQITNVKFLINVLEQIRREDEICTRLFIKIDFVIVGLKEICCLERETTLLEQLVFVLRGKYILAISKCRNELTQRVSLQPEQEMLESSGTECTGGRRSGRGKRSAPEKTTQGLHIHLWKSLSQFTMFGAGSLVKDFLFPAILPYALLERDKCHVINLITIIFLAIGPITIFILSLYPGDDFKKDDKYIHSCWIFMIPKILILIISMCAIHTKRGITHKTRNSQPIILFMTVMLLMFYGFMETVSVVGVSNYVEHISQDKQRSADLQAIQRIVTVFFRYLVYKFSVGYNNTRVNAGFVLPNFKPPEPVGDTFGFWFKGAFFNGWKDLKSDFNLNIKQYLTTTDRKNGQKPILSSLYPDLLM